MSRKPAICVFCGSAAGNNPNYERAADTFGRLIAQSGWRLVYGGGGVGLMGTLARAASRAGGEITGIMPDFLRAHELPPQWAHELVLTTDMAQRKTQMIDAADAFAVLPGGYGTMDELFEVITAAGLGRIGKPVVLVDVDGYFAPLAALMTHMQREGFIRPGDEAICQTAATPEDAARLIGERIEHR